MLHGRFLLEPGKKRDRLYDVQDGELIEVTFEEALEAFRERFSERTAEDLHRCLISFAQLSEVLGAIKNFHNHWPRILNLGRQFSREVMRYYPMSPAKMELLEKLELGLLREIEMSSARLPRRKWKNSYFAKELARAIGSVLKRHGVRLTASDAGGFAYAVGIAFEVFGEPARRGLRSNAGESDLRRYLDYAIEPTNDEAKPYETPGSGVSFENGCMLIREEFDGEKRKTSRTGKHRTLRRRTPR